MAPLNDNVTTILLVVIIDAIAIHIEIAPNTTIKLQDCLTNLSTSTKRSAIFYTLNSSNVVNFTFTLFATDRLVAICICKLFHEVLCMLGCNCKCFRMFAFVQSRSLLVFL